MCEIDLSVVVIFYNQKKYVRQTIESILTQKTKYKIEILMGDDKSTDGTAELLQEYQEKYPDICRYFELPKENRRFEILERQTDNRIYLLQYTKGRYVNFLDGDDYYLGDNKFEKQIDALEKHPECSASFHPYFYHWEDTNQEDTLYCDLGDEKKIISYKKYWRRYYAHSAAFIYRNIYKDRTSVLKGRIFDDNIITLWHLDNKDIIYIPDRCFAYRQLADSTWNKIDDIDREIINLKACEDCLNIDNQLKNGLEKETILRFRKSYDYVAKARKNGFEIRFLNDKFSDKSFVVRMSKFRKANLFSKISTNLYLAGLKFSIFVSRVKGVISDKKTDR